MFKLTDRRMERVRPILDKYRRELRERRTFDGSMFEHEMRDALDTGYQEMKDVAIQLARHPLYRGVAIRYMESGFAPCSEFTLELPKLYGTACYRDGGYEACRAIVWRSIWTELGNSNLEPPKTDWD